MNNKSSATNFFSKLLLLFFYSSLTFSQSPAQQLQHQLASVRTMQAHFQQKTVADDKVVQQSLGNMVLSRPGKFYWQIHGLSDQLIITNGEKLWIYDKDLQQVTVRAVAQLPEDVPGLLLAGSLDYIQQHYTIEIAKQKVGDSITFKLIPKGKQSLFRYALLTFDKGMPQKLAIIDNIQQTTTLVFTQVKVNISTAENIFEFTPPSGVDIVTQQ